MFSKSLEASLNLAFTLAKEKRYELMTVEHLLLILLDNAEAAEVLLACGADLDKLRENLRIFIDETTPILAAERNAEPTLGFQRVLQRAVFQVQSLGHTEVTGANVLSAIFGEQESQAIYFLNQENVTRLDVVNYISHGITKRSFSDPELQIQPGREQEIEEQDPASSIEHYTVNLNRQASLGKIDPLIGRQEEIMRTIQVLCRRHKNNPLLVGDAGVGKTAIAEGLAQLIVQREVPEVLLGSTVYCLDIGLLLAGTKYRGDFEKRFKSVLKEIKKIPGAIIFIDEIHTLIGAGAASGGAVDAANLIKPLLSNGGMRCIGSTTYQEYRTTFEKDHALARRFQKIDIAEPSVEQAYQILKGLKKRFEEYHGVKYTLPALKSAAELSAKYITDRHLPDKAIDVVDEAGALQQLLSTEKRKKVIGRKEIEETVAKIANIPSQNISSSDKQMLSHLERNLKMMIFGQNNAIESLATAIKLSRAGLRDENKPIGSFLFAGPTGVGKTEVAKQLAKILGIELLRFDMSEYMERHAVSRLIGAPPGYVGYESGGLLTEAVNKTPYAVLLLDEIEKAHPDIFNILLQVMDHGTLTDNNGRSADFRHVVLIMTSNAGAEDMVKTSMGFTPQDHHSDAIAAVNKFFSPEFRNRLDGIIQFNPLDTEVLHLVVDKFIMELEVQLEEKGVALEVDRDAKLWLAKNGYDEKMGARPMARLIQEAIKKPLADELLFGRLVNGGVVEIHVKSDHLDFEMIGKSDVVVKTA